MIYLRSLRNGIPQNGRRLFGVAACLVFVACGTEQPDDVETRSGAMVSNQTMTMVVPAYYSSDSPAWTDFINALPTVSFANAGSMFIIVNGGASEPDFWFDPTLASHI